MTARVVVVVFAVALAAGVWVLREQTMTVRERTQPGTASRIEIEVDAEFGHLPSAKRPSDVAAALFNACLLDVRGTPSLPPERTGPSRFAVVVRPAMDDDHADQLRGCLEDWTTDHALADVVELRDYKER